ncbi:hypothetical protein HWI79_497 [Cryptosporidium felis]|nr:hypothetical protein HWI79_497 [Cryptosporidium felis]
MLGVFRYNPVSNLIPILAALEASESPGKVDVAAFAAGPVSVLTLHGIRVSKAYRTASEEAGRTGSLLNLEARSEIAEFKTQDARSKTLLGPFSLIMSRISVSTISEVLDPASMGLLPEQGPVPLGTEAETQPVLTSPPPPFPLTQPGFHLPEPTPPMPSLPPGLRSGAEKSPGIGSADLDSDPKPEIAKGSEPGGAGRLQGGEHSSATVGVYEADVDLADDKVQTKDLGDEKMFIIGPPPVIPDEWPVCSSFALGASLDRRVLPSTELLPVWPTMAFSQLCCWPGIPSIWHAPTLEAWGVSRWELSIMLDISSK